MKGMQKISPTSITDNMIDRIGNQWMLITAGKAEKFNTMTASWGGVGFLWNRPVAFAVVRPVRYTYEFTEREERFTLSFFGKEYKKALSICGSKSGRNTDKMAETGLTPLVTELGNIAFEEANLILECRKLYADDLRESAFLDRAPLDQWYGNEPLHKMYIAEIESVWIQ